MTPCPKTPGSQPSPKGSQHGGKWLPAGVVPEGAQSPQGAQCPRLCVSQLCSKILEKTANPQWNQNITLPAMVSLALPPTDPPQEALGLGPWGAPGPVFSSIRGTLDFCVEEGMPLSSKHYSSHASFSLLSFLPCVRK